MKNEKDRNIYSTIPLDGLSNYVLNALNAHIAILNKDGEIVAYNKKWKLFGEDLAEKWYRPDLNENFLRCLQKPLADGDDFALRMLIGCKAVLGGEKESFEINYPIQIGSEKHWFKATLNILEENKGAVFIHEDIRHQVQSRQFIRETKQKFNQYFENTLYGIVVADKDNNIIEINKAAAQLLESQHDKLLFEKITKFLNLNIDIGKIQTLINRNSNYLGELEIKTAEENIIPVEMHVSLFRNENGVPVTSWMFKDISEKRRSEKALIMSDKRYRLQFENSNEGIILARPDGVILEANRAACVILGYSPEELAGQHQRLIYKGNTDIKKQVKNLREKSGFFSGELEFIHKSEKIITVEINSSVYSLEDGAKRTVINFKDISSRKKVEEQLLIEKNFTESAISSLPNIFFVFNSTGKLVRWNPVVEQDFGYTADEVSEMNIMDFIHPDDHESVIEYLSVDHGGKPINIELRCITKNNEILYYHFSGKGFAQDGEHYTVGGGINLTDYKKVELEKKKNSELLTQLFFNSPIGIVLIDQDGRVKSTNKSFESIFGYTNTEIKDQILDSIIVPESMGAQAKSLSNFSFTGDSFQTEATRIRKDGKEIPVLIGGVPVEIEGEVIAIYGMYVDITERKKLEYQIVELLENEKKARLHMEDMFDEAPSAIAMLEGEDHIFTFVNDKYKELTGHKHLVGKSLKDALPELSSQGFIENLDRCYKEGKPYHFSEQPIRLSNYPNLQFLNLVYKPLFDENEKVYGIFLQAINVTEQVEARNLISKSLREKETLLNEVHHRVKNNLAIISGLLELQIMDTNDEKINKHLDSTQSRITTIAKIHEMLYQNESLSHVSFSEYVENMVKDEKQRFHNSDKPMFSNYHLDDVQLNVNQAIPAGMLLNEVISYLLELCPGEASNQNSPGMELSLIENGENVSIEIRDFSKHILQQFNTENENLGALRRDLINVLLKQTHGKMKISLEEAHVLTISFNKREVKGSHSGLSK